MVATVASNVTAYTIPAFCTNEAGCQFQVRYRNGTTFGPLSNLYQVDVQV
jgi:hypothetical protein